MMSLRPTIWSRISRPSILFLGLALAVFAWGLQYKLSLYDPPQAASHEIPQAKLLSRHEQSGTSESPLITKTSVPDKMMQTALLGLLFALFLAWNMPRRLELFGKYSDTRQPVRPPDQASLNAFFFRPPPVFV
jgi:hypothetical protein